MWQKEGAAVDMEIFGIVVLVAAGLLVIGSKRIGTMWVEMSGLEQVKFIPAKAMPWIGAGASIVFALALAAIGARILGWWG